MIKLYLLPPKRWSKALKKKLITRIRFLTFLALLLILALPPLGFLSRIGYDLTIRPYVVKKQMEKQIIALWLKINPKLDPVYIETLAKVTVRESPPINPLFITFILIHESQGFPDKVGPPIPGSEKRANGVAMIHEDNWEDHIPQYVRYHLVPQVGKAKQIFLEGYAKTGTVLGALEHYVGQKKNIKRKYIRGICAGFLAETGYWKVGKIEQKKEEEKEEEDEGL